LTTLQAANWKGILIGVEVDPGHPNDNESGYRSFVFKHTNYFVVSGAMSHRWIRYGRDFVPEFVDEYMRNNPDNQLTLGIGHLFYHHDEFPRELSDNTIPIEERRRLAQEYMERRVEEVLDIVSPLMEKYPNLKVEFNLSNEAIWEYNGNVGWEGEYSDYPLYDLFGKNWLQELI